MTEEQVGRLFLHLASIYGSRMEAMWGKVDADRVRKAWATELREFEPVDVKWAVDQLKFCAESFPPTAYEFAKLCRDSRHKRKPNPYLSAPKNPPSPEVMANVRSLVAKLKGRAA